MKMSRFVFVLALLLPTAVFANPISVERTVAVQVPNTPHVQFSFLCMDFTNSCEVPVGVKRDGVQLAVTLTAPTPITINGGSGLDSYDAVQACDCDVAVGEHSYEVVYGAASSMVPYPTTVTVTDPPPGPPTPIDTDITADSPDVMAWNIPEQPWPKGVDCVAVCDAASNVEVVEQVTAEGEDTRPAVNPTKEDSGGCSIGSAHATQNGLGAGLLLLGLAALGLVARRRRG